MPSRSPEEALQSLAEGNARFVANELTSLGCDLKSMRELTVKTQHPFAAILACADSRVPVEIVFDQLIGSLFVTRVAGNIATPEITGSLEYAVAVLGVRLVLVLGHRGCGAVQAAIQGAEVPGEIGSLFPHLAPAVAAGKSEWEPSVRANAVLQAAKLRESVVMSSRLREGQIRIDAAYYDIESGVVTML